MKRVKWFLLFSVMLYIILLIPFDDRKHVNFDIEQPQRPVFSWGQNAYWQTLEAQYVELKQQGCNKAEVALTSNFEKLKKLIKRASVESLAPGHPIFKQLETLVFETGPVVSVCETSVMEYIKLIADMRAVIKQQSINWNIRSHATRTTLYRLLYGSRAAAEETILQSRSDLVLSLVHGTDEPSKTPYADLHDVRLRSGDILVSRGGAATSALIARGNNYPGNFSHIALVYIESDTQTPYIIEAHIEQGVVVSTAEQYLKDKKLRIMLLRPRADLGPLVADAMIPHKAAKYAYNRAISEHTPYDFEMNYKDHRKLFCSEVASSAYEQFDITLWSGLSYISSAGLRNWLAGFGVKHFETQEPSDLEYDPQLVVVAEWRNQKTLKNDHYDNAVTEVMLEGADQGEPLKYQWYMLPMMRLIKLYSATLNLMERTGPVPEGMSSYAALRNLWYTKKHAEISAELARESILFSTKHGYEPPYWELLQLARRAKTQLQADAE